MHRKEVPIEFASALEVAGPTSDGMVHITFLRQEIGQRSEPKFHSSHPGFTAEGADTEARSVPVATIMFPYSRFKSLGLVFTKLSEELQKAVQEETEGRENPKEAAPSRTATGDDGDA